jgi:hypothetical protein
MSEVLCVGHGANRTGLEAFGYHIWGMGGLH